MIFFPELYTIYFMCLGNKMSVSSWLQDDKHGGIMIRHNVGKSVMHT